MKPISQALVFISWLIALSAMIATLYASELLHWPVCHLCWYQRIALYPLVIILGISAYHNDNQGIRYAIIFPVIGFVFAVYQYLEQMIPGFSPIALCGDGVACSNIHIKIAGFITLPLLSAIACFIIFILLQLANKK